ncbi:MAG TPA: TetR family transcriptional regulator [Stellaceae bacterium]|nr:TetR family transcriptional regulator [Stellaceae bacterium]
MISPDGAVERAAESEAARSSAEEPARRRLLRVAEQLFAEHGFKGVSVRALTAAAGVNLAGVNYYFGSKEGLLAAIFDAHCRPMAEERLARLALCAERPGAPPLLEQIIAAFIGPALASAADGSGGGASFTRLRAVLAHENNGLAKRLIAEHFDATSRRFIDALAGAAPHLDRAEVFWRFQFLLGALYYTMMTPDRIRHLSEGVCDPAEVARAEDEMVRFLAAGFRAPAGLPQGMANDRLLPLPASRDGAGMRRHRSRASGKGRAASDGSSS